MMETRERKGARWVSGGVLVVVVAGAVYAVPRLCWLAASTTYYLEVSAASLALFLIALAVAIVATWTRDRAWGVSALLWLVLGVKLAHATIYLPEIRYRTGQGPWGRAIGQWIPPGRPLYVFHSWPHDLAFAIGRPTRQLMAPAWLDSAPGRGPHYVLLQQSEWDAWPDVAPKLVKVRDFEDERGGHRVLARTEGSLVNEARRATHERDN
jgi:hypothetical protein